MPDGSRTMTSNRHPAALSPAPTNSPAGPNAEAASTAAVPISGDGSVAGGSTNSDTAVGTAIGSGRSSMATAPASTTLDPHPHGTDRLAHQRPVSGTGEGPKCNINGVPDRSVRPHRPSVCPLDVRHSAGRVVWQLDIQPGRQHRTNTPSRVCITVDREEVGHEPLGVRDGQALFLFRNHRHQVGLGESQPCILQRRRLRRHRRRLGDAPADVQPPLWTRGHRGRWGSSPPQPPGRSASR